VIVYIRAAGWRFLMAMTEGPVTTRQIVILNVPGLRWDGQDHLGWPSFSSFRSPSTYFSPDNNPIPLTFSFVQERSFAASRDRW